MDKSRLRPFGLIFEKSLNDLIRGIRKRRDPELLAEYFKRVIAECREEARSPDMDTKAMAVLKLTYLEMYGFDMSWAGFHVLEVMSSSKFQQKRIGYLAAMQSFHSDTELLMLSTNLIKTDLASSAQQRVAISLSGLANIVTPFLAVDIAEDIVKMLNHSQPYIRKKAILAMYKVILQYPEALQNAIPRLREKLDDEDTSVVSAAVNVICELANNTANPRPYIELAPDLYELLTTSKNNWCLIKILKLFSIFTVHEPRLKTRILPHVVDLMNTTPAMSLLYECISSILKGNMLEADDYELARNCVTKLRTLIEEHDPNLKFVGLQALSQLARINPEFLANDHSIILECIDDPDLSIRRKVLDMLVYIVDDDSLFEIVNQLMDQIRAESLTFVADGDADYDKQVLTTITALCSARNYEYLPNFEWYTEILVEIATLTHQKVENLGEIIGYQLQNVAVRVKSVRSIVVNACINLSLNRSVTKKQPQLLDCTMWVIGEYIADYLDNTNFSSSRQLITNLLDVPVNAVSIPCITKVFTRWVQLISYWSESQASNLSECIAEISEHFSKVITSADSEIQERAVQFLELFKLGAEALESHPNDSNEPPALLTVAFPSLFEGFDMTPIAVTSQQRIQPPADLDLDTPVQVPSISFSESEEESEYEPEEIVEMAPQRKPRHDAKLDPYYIKPEQEEYSDADAEGQADQSGIESSAAPTREVSPVAVLNIPTTKPARPKKVHKVKVEIAQDESVGSGDFVPPQEKKESKKKPLFHIANRLNALDLDDSTANTNTETERSQEVLVKHKKIDKKKKEKSTKTKTKKKSKEGKTSSSKEPITPTI